MVMELYESLLDEFSKVINIPPLKPDSNHSCLIKLPEDGAKIQIEIDKTGDFLMLASNVGFVPPGRYREALFREALHHNNSPHPRNGTFCYSDNTKQLMLMEYLYIKELNGEKIASVFEPFAERATLWKQAIEKGEIPVGTESVRKGGSGMFGL